VPSGEGDYLASSVCTCSEQVAHQNVFPVQEVVQAVLFLSRELVGVVEGGAEVCCCLWDDVSGGEHGCCSGVELARVRSF